MPIKPAKHSRNRDRRLGMAAVRRDHRVHVVRWDEILIVLGVKAGIQRHGRAMPINANLLGEVHQSGQGFGQNHRILLGDGFDGDGTDDKIMVVPNGQFLFSCLVLMTGIPDAEAPFFTTALEPSPCRTEVTS
jgi:hypothetical protein